MPWRNTILALMLGTLAQTGAAQDLRAPSYDIEAVVVPQMRSLSLPLARPDNREAGRFGDPTTGPQADGAAMCIVPKVSAHVSLKNENAETELRFQCQNNGSHAIQAPFACPVPQGAMLSENANEKKGDVGRLAAAPNCTLHPVREASAIWQNLAKQQANPAAVEFCGLPLLKTNAIDIPAGQSQPITLKYALTCPSSGPRVDYVLPRSESVEYNVPWSMQVDIQSDQPIATVYSPSHKLTSKRLSPNSFQVKVDEGEAAQPGNFWLSYLRDQGGLSATLFTQPDDATPEADGTFLFLAGVSANPAAGKGIPRELTLALDRSGSMQGQKIEQVREAATQVLNGLNEDESFNIITYNDKVNSFADRPVRKTAENFDAACKFIESVQPRGGTNLHGALLESVRQEPSPRTLPIVLFLTDGLPTVGETAEATIRDVIAAKNPYHQRIFTVGVGVDVNTPLLEIIASETRALPTFVLPAENIKTKVSQVFQSLERPILADAGLDILDSTTERADSQRVSDVFPDPLPDLFQDDHLVVLGRYRGTDPLTFRVQGNYLGTERTFEFTFPLKQQPAYSFVSRLWATQKIAALVQEIRKSGATADPYEILANPKQDAQLKSLAEDILKLTTRYGILTEYTAFLAKDTGPWLNQDEQLETAYRNLEERAVKIRVGLPSVIQSINNTLLQRQYSLNGANYFWDANMQRVGQPNVQQMGNGAYFLRGNTWVDGRLVDRPNIAPTQVVTFGSAGYEKLLRQLVTTGEHAPLSLRGNVLMEIDNKPVLIRGLERAAVSSGRQVDVAAPAKVKAD